MRSASQGLQRRCPWLCHNPGHCSKRLCLVVSCAQRTAKPRRSSCSWPRFISDGTTGMHVDASGPPKMCSVCAAYGATFSRLPELAAAARAPQWALAAVAAGCLALVFASVYVTQVEKRLPLVYYKRHARVRPPTSQRRTSLARYGVGEHVPGPGRPAADSRLL